MCCTVPRLHPLPGQLAASIPRQSRLACYARCGPAADDGHAEVVRQLLRSGTVDLNLQSNGARGDASVRGATFSRFAAAELA